MSVPARRSDFLWIGLVLGAVLLVFGRSLAYGFLSWDDGLHVTQNPGLRPVGWASLAAYWRGPFAGLYIPATYTLYAALAAICQGPWSVTPGGTQLWPAVFHATNVAVHVANVLVLFVLARRLLQGNALAAALAAGVLAVHPLVVESVAWVSELKGLLCGLFALTALVCLDRSADPALETRSMRFVWLLAATMAFAVAMLAKPSAAAWPVCAWVLLWGFGRRLSTAHLVTLGIWLVFVVAVTLLTKSQQTNANIEYIPPLTERLPLAAHALSHYAWKALIPLGLVADYGAAPVWVVKQSWFQIFWLIGAGGIALVLSIVWLSLRRPERQGIRVLLGALLGGLAALLPVVGLVPFDFQDISTVADRYAYLALIGPALGVSWLAARFARVEVYLATGLLLVAYAAISFQQVQHWRDDRSLWVRNIDIRPESFVALRGLGAWYAAGGQTSEALQYYERSFAMKQDANVANNVAWIRATHPDAQFRNGALALKLARAISAPPRDGDPAVLDTLAAALAECGQFAEATTTAERAATIAHAQGFPDLAQLLRERAALYRAGKPYRERATYSLPGTS